MDSVQANYDNAHIRVSSLPRPLYANLKYANLKNNVEIENGQEGLDKDEFLDAQDKGVSWSKDYDMEILEYGERY